MKEVQWLSIRTSNRKVIALGSTPGVRLLLGQFGLSFSEYACVTVTFSLPSSSSNVSSGYYFNRRVTRFHDTLFGHVTF